MQRYTKPAPEEDLLKKEVDVEQQLGWQSGSALMKTQAARSYCQRDFRRNDLAVGILFQNPGSEVTWHLDGKLVLAKAWSPKAISRDLVVLPPGCEFHARCQGSGQGLWLFLDPQSITSDDRVQSFIKRMTVDYSWTKDRLAWMVASEIRKECKNGFPRGAMFLESAAMIFVTQLAYVLDEAVPHFEPIRALSDTKLRAIIDYIDSNLDRNITLSELSAIVQLTPRYFCGAFKQAIGRPPHQYLIEQRVERARVLLQDPNLSLIDVALIVGFNSQSHLNDHFRRIVGITPARYRSEMQPNKVQAAARKPFS
jgi:AraC family transcriptional regulator